MPLSAHIRKELFYKFFQGFAQSITADPALIKTEILFKLRQLDRIYGVRHASEKESKKAESLTFKETTGTTLRFFTCRLAVSGRRPCS